MEEQPVAPKPFYQSKTFWLQVLGVVAIAVPKSRALIGEYFAEVGIGWALVNTILRFVTKGKIEIA